MHDSFEIAREHGMLLHCQRWLPERIKALIVLVHGIGEHASRYGKVAMELNKAGFAVFAFDLRGHGRSGGKRGHAGSFRVMKDDLDAVIRKSREIAGNAPLFIYGHSLGGGIVLSRMLQSDAPASGYIVTSPWLELVEKKPAILIYVSRVLRSIYPSFTLPTNLDANLLSSDEAVADQYRNDPLVHGMISAATAIDAIDSASSVLNVEKIDPPLFIAHGRNDGIVSIEGSRKLAGKVNGCGKYLEMDGTHELHNEPGCFAPLMEGVISFVEANL